MRINEHEWELVEGLNLPYQEDADSTHAQSRQVRAVPQVTKVAELEGATVVRLSFRAGDTMANHKAPRPILVLGQTGSVTFTIGDADAGEPVDEITLAPGKAVHVDEGKIHALHADAPAVVTLLILG